MNRSRLQEQYVSKLRPELQKKLNIKNIMEVPKISKIVINIGVKEAVSDSKVLQMIVKVLTRIAGQKPVTTVARKSIAGFKLLLFL